MERLRGWIRARPILWASVGLIVALFLGFAIGNAGKGDLENEKRELQKAVAHANEQQEEAEAKVSWVREHEANILGSARARAQQLVANGRMEAQQLESLQGKISSAESELASVQESIGEAEGSLEEAEHQKALTSFGPGIMKAEVDFTPGTYEAPGGPGCYWALLTSANTNEISANEFTGEAGQQIVDITTPYFQSSGCGTWKRIGE